MRRIVLYITVFCLFTSVFAQSGRGTFGSQRKSEGSLLLALGPAWLSGDIGGATLKSFPSIMDNTHIMFSAGFRQRFNRTNLGYKLMFQYGNFFAADTGSRPESQRYAYRTDLFTASLQGEYHFLRKNFSPSSGLGLYVFTGLGMGYSMVEFTESPAAGSRPDDEIQMEGAYPFVPVGLGVKFKLAPRFKLGIEFGYFYYFTDFLDGLHTLHSNYDDTLMGISFTASYRIFGGAGKRNEDICHGCQ